MYQIIAAIMLAYLCAGILSVMFMSMLPIGLLFVINLIAVIVGSLGFALTKLLEYCNDET